MPAGHDRLRREIVHDPSAKNVSAENSMVCAMADQKSRKLAGSLGNVNRRSPRHFSMGSPSASTSKGFFVQGMGVAARGSCSFSRTRRSSVRGESTKLLFALANTWFKSRRQSGRGRMVVPRKNGGTNSRDRIRSHVADARGVRSLNSRAGSTIFPRGLARSSEVRRRNGGKR